MPDLVPAQHQSGASFEHDSGRSVDGRWTSLFEPERDTIGRLFGGLVGQMTYDAEGPRFYAIAGFPDSRLDEVLVLASAATARECHAKLHDGAREVSRIMDRAAKPVDVMPHDRPVLGGLYRGGRVTRVRLDEVGRPPLAWVFGVEEVNN